MTGIKVSVALLHRNVLEERMKNDFSGNCEFQDVSPNVADDFSVMTMNFASNPVYSSSTADFSNIKFRWAL